MNMHTNRNRIERNKNCEKYLPQGDINIIVILFVFVERGANASSQVTIRSNYSVFVFVHVQVVNSFFFFFFFLCCFSLFRSTKTQEMKTKKKWCVTLKICKRWRALTFAIDWKSNNERLDLPSSIAEEKRKQNWQIQIKTHSNSYFFIEAECKLATIFSSLLSSFFWMEKGVESSVLNSIWELNMIFFWFH